MGDRGGGELSGRRAVVTGGAKGIGAAIAAALAAAGADVGVLGRDAAALRASGYRHQVADVTDEAALVGALEALGPADILVNNAGAAFSGPLGRHGGADWAAMLAVNLTPCFVAMRQVLPGMVARGWGRIVSVASTAGLKGYAYTPAYCAAKHGVIGLTRAVALEAARSGVTVNAVCPGFTETALVDRAVEVIVARTGQDAGAARAALARSNPQDRLIRPEEVAAAVLYLCGPGAAGVTGQALAVAGGEVM